MKKYIAVFCLFTITTTAGQNISFYDEEKKINLALAQEILNLIVPVLNQLADNHYSAPDYSRFYQQLIANTCAPQIDRSNIAQLFESKASSHLNTSLFQFSELVTLFKWVCSYGNNPLKPRGLVALRQMPWVLSWLQEKYPEFNSSKYTYLFKKILSQTDPYPRDPGNIKLQQALYNLSMQELQQMQRTFFKLAFNQPDTLAPLMIRQLNEGIAALLQRDILTARRLSDPPTLQVFTSTSKGSPAGLRIYFEGDINFRRYLVKIHLPRYLLQGSPVPLNTLKGIVENTLKLETYSSQLAYPPILAAVIEQLQNLAAVDLQPAYVIPIEVSDNAELFLSHIDKIPGWEEFVEYERRQSANFTSRGTSPSKI